MNTDKNNNLPMSDIELRARLKHIHEDLKELKNRPRGLDWWDVFCCCSWAVFLIKGCS